MVVMLPMVGVASASEPKNPAGSLGVLFPMRGLDYGFFRGRVGRLWLSVAAVCALGGGVVACRAAEPAAGAIRTESGPWGDLQLRELNLEQPAEYVAFEKTDWSGPRWRFGARSEVEVARVLAEAGCDAALAARLLAAREADAGGGFVIRPDDATVLGLAPATRARLYRVLADDPLNRAQAAPTYVPGGDAARLLAGRLHGDDALARAVGGLLYQQNGYTYFADREVAARAAGLDDAARKKFRLAVSATPIVMARVWVGQESNVDAAVNYWGLSMPGVMIKDIRPLFEAQRQWSDGGAVSILYVLPPMARANLYTTPLTPTGAEALPDCHFTALNFFNATPDPRLSDLAYAAQYIGAHYYEIGAPSMAGDLVVLLDGANQIVHSATYLAADVVYTKNGINLGQPWVLMHLDDMVGSYSSREPVRVGYLRKRG